MIARLFIALIRVYQRTLSPLLGNVCRFHPSCSRYAAACLENHGAWRGSLLSIRRVCKCHPFHPGGLDLPPPPPPGTPGAGQRQAGPPADPPSEDPQASS
jgi:hypothetical protein